MSITILGIQTFCLKGLAVATLLGLGLSGCGSTPEPEAMAPPPIQSEVEASPQPSEPLTAAIAPPDPTTEALLEAYLNQLQSQGWAANHQGTWIQSSQTLLGEHQGTLPLPAASLTKVATSLAALATYEPQHRFTTQVNTTGPIEHGILQGDLVIEGGEDPFFVWESAMTLGQSLQEKGIRTVAGNLVIVGPFYMNYESDPQIAGDLLAQGLNHQTWSAAAEAQYQTLPPGSLRPQIQIEGAIFTSETLPTQAQPLARYDSLPLVELLKRMNRYSNNWMADSLAETVGGARAVAQIAAARAGVPAAEIQLVNGSGLSEQNRMSPRAACALMLALSQMLQQHDLSLADVLAVVGEDQGILSDRPLPRYAALKSGTLSTVSALAGVLPTQTHGLVWMAILNDQGDVDVYRARQEQLLQIFLGRWGALSELPSPLRPRLPAPDIQPRISLQ
ncbi:D-alanyl-D-alanine carboxypeptidase [Synechococcales cyanobacterium C]|uniref:D-alanyl-D-alanine carboxypeptidase n=1 Tax=Petrachloros mirabilis ULC683 TaxID=2781853 RepID=A0A8K1ZXP6_9CYAN|nr:D-alanyl-D-alanine carboxypeptidase [Petrachloros mirabilis]NCJ06001.1 D-alanyl-D-alanine carboxypeptidase [Petrachloros mirabilis ULC683]